MTSTRISNIAAMAHTTPSPYRPTLCLDFDGVIHSYTSGWKGIDTVADDPVDGAMEFIVNGLEHFSIHIYSSRSSQKGGRKAMKDWLREHLQEYYYEGECGKYLPHKTDALAIATASQMVGPIWAKLIVKKLHWPKEKPKPFLTIDDRAICFDGTWPDYQTLRNFKPWYRKDE